MPKISNIKIATVRDLIAFFEDVAVRHGDQVIPYFWNDPGDKEFVLLGQIERATVDSKMHSTRKFVSLETFDPDPDNERDVSLEQLITP